MAKFKIVFKKELVQEVSIEIEAADQMIALDTARTRAKELTANEPNTSGKTTWNMSALTEIGE